MCFGPQPYRMAAVRKVEGSIREAKTQTVPCLGKIPNEAISIQQMPTVKVPSIYDDAVSNAKLMSDKLKVNVDNILSKAEKLQSSISEEISQVQSSIQTAVGSAVGEITAKGSELGSKLKGALGQAKSSAFGSVSDVFPSSRAKECVALGAPDLNKIDKKAFSGKLGGVASTPQVESDQIDLEESENLDLAEKLKGGIPSPTSVLGSKLPKPPIPSIPAPVIPVDDVPIISYDIPSLDIGSLDGGGF